MSAEDISNALPATTMAQLIADIAQAVDLNIPAPGEKTLFFERQLVERVKANKKKAVMYDELILPIRKAINGR